MADRTVITTPDLVTLEFELAGLGSRLMAWLVDSFLIGLLFLVMFLILMGVGLGTILGLELDDDKSGLFSSVGIAILMLIYFVVSWGYGLLFETVMRGRTPGKRVMGLRVIRDDGLPIGLREAATRNLVRAADMLPPPLYVLGALVSNFDPQHRRLGDMVAGTLVVVERFDVRFGSRLGAAYAARLEKGQSRQALNLPGGTLTVQQLDLLEQYLSRKEQLNSERRDALASKFGEPLISLLALEPTFISKEPNKTFALEKLMQDVLARAQTEAIEGEQAARTPGLF